VPRSASTARASSLRAGTTPRACGTSNLLRARSNNGATSPDAVRSCWTAPSWCAGVGRA